MFPAARDLPECNPHLPTFPLANVTKLFYRVRFTYHKNIIPTLPLNSLCEGVISKGSWKMGLLVPSLCTPLPYRGPNTLSAHVVSGSLPPDRALQPCPSPHLYSLDSPRPVSLLLAKYVPQNNILGCHSKKGPILLKSTRLNKQDPFLQGHETPSM